MAHRWFALVGILLFASLLTAEGRSSKQMPLHEGWAIQSACKVTDGGDAISKSAYRTKGWFPTTVPMTVVAALVNNKVYPDPYYGLNLRSYPGMTYPIGTIFTNQPMSDDSPFKCAWWYRTQFQVPANEKGKKLWLHFDGINYRANIWLNGQLIAGPDRIAGAWRTYELEVSDRVIVGKPNVLAVQVTAQTENDLGINWVDWNPAPPDKNLGLWRDVYLTTSGPVALRGTQVISNLDTSTLATADLTIRAELTNVTEKTISGKLEAVIDKIRVIKQVELSPGEIQNVSLTSGEFKQLHIDKPRVWWPAKLGKQELYKLNLSFVAGSQVSDSDTVEFGIRQVTSELTDKGHRLFKINGNNILIRGGGWAPDMLYRTSAKRQEQELHYLLDMGLNTVRMEGKIENEHFFELADRMGVLVMAGWCCCSHWEKWDQWTPTDKTIALESLRSQITRLRNHPSVFVWLNGSDNPPPAQVEQAYLDVEKELNWPNPVVSSASAQATTVSGASGVKMSGPYEYVPPMYWYTDLEMKYGGAYGFNTETSPGPAPPPIESIQKMMPKEHWWPIDEVWSYHAGTGKFRTLGIFNSAMDARYGHPDNLRDFAKRAQVMTYENERAMFEAYSGNKYTSTGVIQWMLNNAWPGLIWHLYDYYLLPGGGYFGTKKACEPLHVQYAYNDGSVWVVNSLYQASPKMKVHVTVYNLDMTEKFANDVTLDIAPDSSTKALTLPKLENLSPTYFVRLELREPNNKVVSTNFYWLSTRPEILDWSKTNYYVTPVVQHPDLQALNTLPEVKLLASSKTVRHGTEDFADVTLTNPTKSLAFAVSLRLTNRRGDDVLPVIFEDNYFPLMPGEKRTVRIKYAIEDLHDGPAEVHVEGWNVKPTRVRPGGAMQAPRVKPVAMSSAD
jgi:exo-1,4-beta-D-glucosaminidase